MAWDSYEPTLVGVVWQPPESLSEMLDSDLKCAAIRMRSTVAETIDKEVVFFDAVNAPGNYLIEVFPAGSEECGPITTDTFRPNEDTNATNVQNQAGAVVNLYQSIDDVVLNTADYIKNVSPPLDASYTCKLDTAAWPAGRRVTDLRIVMVGEQILGTMAWHVELRKQGAVFIRVDRRNHTTAEGIFTVSISVGELNPFTGLPWTQAEITSFDSTVAADRLSLVFRFLGMSTIFDGGYLYQTYVEIDWVPENRLAVGRSTVTVPQFATSFDLLNPNTGADNWAKAAATDYTWALRRVVAQGSPGAVTGGPKGRSTGQAAWRYLQTVDAQPVDIFTLTDGESFLPLIDDQGCIVDMGDAGTRGFFLVHRTTAPATSVDGQPYDRIGTAIVDSATFARQEITPALSTTVRQVVFLAFLASDDFLPADDLTVQVYVDATNVAVGGPATVTTDDLKAAAGPDPVGTPGIKQVIAELSASAALVAGTQYRIEFTSPGTDPSVPWQLQAYESTFGYGVTTWNGTTDRGDINGTGYDGDVDMAAALIAPPFTPRDMAAAVTTLPTLNVGDCGPASVDVVDLEWEWPPSISADAYIEIQRSADGGATWLDVATVLDQAVTTFRDLAAPRTWPGLVDCVCYRWRLVDLVPSDWTPYGSCASSTIVDDGTGTAGPIGEVDDAGEDWITVGTWERNGAELLTTTAAGTRRLALANAAQTDYYVQAKVGTFRDSGWGIVGRFEDASNYVYAFLDPGTSSWQIRHVVAGVHTTIAGPVVATTISGTVARLVFTSPNMVELLVNAVSILGPVAHSATLDSPLGGLFANTATTPANRWDDFTMDVPDVCAAPVAYGCELVFSSNESGQIFVYADIWPVGFEKRRYQFLDADRVKVYPIYDRNRQVAFQPSERLGDEWTVDLVLSSVDEPTPGPGRVVFDDFVAFSRADLPYINVLDQYGRVWLAVLRIPEGRIWEPGKTYVVPCTITEVAEFPIPVVVP